MNFKKKVTLLLACSIIFISQLAMVEALTKSEYSSNFTRNNILTESPLENSPITTFGGGADPWID